MAAPHRRERKRINDPEGLRRRLLDVAFDAFQAGGYHATSIHELMRLAGATGGALHHHFPSKKALGLAVLHERVAAAVEATWIAPVASAASARSGILAVFEAIATGLDERGAVRGCPLNNLALELSLADAEFRAAAEGIFAGWRQALAAKFRAERSDQPETLATFVVAAYSGAMALAKAEQRAAPLRACAGQLALMLGQPGATTTTLQGRPG
ncbi:TetR/AcrR family transcriptional regulator [Phreatobacter stygius]|uniref:TetR/AcrR family transcriptional regulator n=1 Tax=Phreatobacter stygius TaxID=1940610 RepID=A0A4D7BA83_9HYPH|nr:TetR/AcrR family transcriptional regulator [Phreatobacter stygius]QCI67725.1 TetR/AcrR family transcriptional regulator [Phreatobacter stygius]